ncbi:hypothetical protein G7085_08190 [Tessaracoccus sp. HDW20]|uniref:hypothetical protein n=1 Tax=Tessaracoccus coleopterorum TaxID=2714950 RepID=UPI0018D3B931|nr:hypothetical protein [Tessaracoccus coleopterorum]NHB84599.1 hypothetical protein [Tessaracoccus coleopterorum]
MEALHQIQDRASAMGGTLAVDGTEGLTLTLTLPAPQSTRKGPCPPCHRTAGSWRSSALSASSPRCWPPPPT